MTTSHPRAINLDAGTHALCTCGLSQNGTFCDGSHKGSGKMPHLLQLEAPKTVYLCSCTASGNTPFCDGSHTRLVSNAAVAPQKPWWKFW